MKRQTSRMWASADLNGMEMLDADFIRQSCPRHSHDTYAIGIVLRGVNRFTYRGMVHAATSGTLCTVTVDEVHGGDVPDDNGLAYRCLYPKVEQIAALQAEMPGGPRHGLPLLPGVVHDAGAFALVARLFAAEAAGAPALPRQSLLTATLARMIERHGGMRAQYGAAPAPSRGLQKVRDMLLERLAEPPQLEELAILAGMPAFTFLRAFRRSYGLPPHAWLIQARVRRAKERILAGDALATVAADCGFSDQSHMNRQFRRILGVTPGSLRG